MSSLVVGLQLWVSRETSRIGILYITGGAFIKKSMVQ